MKKHPFWATAALTLIFQSLVFCGTALSIHDGGNAPPLWLFGSALLLPLLVVGWFARGWIARPAARLGAVVTGLALAVILPTLFLVGLGGFHLIVGLFPGAKDFLLGYSTSMVLFLAFGAVPGLPLLALLSFWPSRARPLISPQELRALHDPVILDARFRLMNPGEAEKLFLAEHIPGAQRVDLEKDLSGEKTGTNGRHPLPTREALRELFSRLGVGPKSAVVAYDDTDHAGAARLWMLLRYAGFANVRVLEGGLAAWKAAGLPVEAGEGKARARAEFPLNPSLVRVLKAEDLKGRALFDARAPERYRGEVEPIDPKAGHIPGARNLPYASLLREGKFLPARELAAKLPAEKNPVFYCGSGVTACVPLLASFASGKAATLYPGSWSEWSARENAEVER